MLFVIHCIDAADGTPRRMENYPAHKAHLERTADFGVSIVFSGPLVKDDGESPIGSLLVIEAPNRAAVEAYHKADPFYAAKVWQTVTITAFKKTKG